MKWRTLLLGIVTVAVLGLCTPQADAHVQKKTWILQGNASFSSLSGDLHGNETQTVITLNPTIHYAVMDNLAVGGILELASSSVGDYSSLWLGIGPSARYFFGKDTDKHMGSVNPYVGAAVLLKSQSWDTGNQEHDQSGLDCTPEAGQLG